MKWIRNDLCQRPGSELEMVMVSDTLQKKADSTHSEQEWQKTMNFCFQFLIVQHMMHVEQILFYRNQIVWRYFTPLFLPCCLCKEEIRIILQISSVKSPDRLTFITSRNSVRASGFKWPKSPNFSAKSIKSSYEMTPSLFISNKPCKVLILRLQNSLSPWN